MAIQDGIQQVIFWLYYENSGGSVFWEEIVVVEVVGGLYSYNFGSVIELNLDIFSSIVYLGIEVSGSELQLCVQLIYLFYIMFVQYVVIVGWVDNGVLAGIVLLFVGLKMKVFIGYLFCDGCSIVKIEYFDFFNVIGIIYGGIFNGVIFNLFDYWGIFLCGNDEGWGIDDNCEFGSLQQDVMVMLENFFIGEID